MKKIAYWILFNKNGQAILILLIALYIAGLLEKI